MVQQLVLLHRPGGGAPLKAPHWLEIQTCLRSLGLGLKSWEKASMPTDEWEVHTGAAAYGLLLEIACGLKSPVLGETEVFGQIKKACSSYQHPDKKSHNDLQKVIEKMYADVKTIRTRHLKGMGSRSYGSYARKYFKGQSMVRVLGTGVLAKEILPWLTKSVGEVIVHSRSPELKRDLQSKWSVTVEGFGPSSGKDPCGLLVASPMTGAEISTWIQSHKIPVAKVLDLREESAQDPLPQLPAVQVSENLSDVFAVFEKRRASTEHIRSLALAEVKKCVQSRLQKVEPGKGWDECAG